MLCDIIQNMGKRLVKIILAVCILLILAGCRAQDHADPAPVMPQTPVITIEDNTETPVLNEEDPAVDDASAVDEKVSDSASVPSADESFYAEEISDEVFARMQGKSFPEGCTTAREDLRYLNLLYKDIDGNTHAGEMVCNKAIADTLIDIFRQLYEADYPIEKMRLIDDYDGDDDASMIDNNTSCFNYRIVSDTTHLSNHAYGLAVDLNPLYNPYIRQKGGVTVVEPPEGEPYADRANDFNYKIDKDDLAYKLFTEAGFTWGGSWKSVKDYQHFEKP